MGKIRAPAPGSANPVASRRELGLRLRSLRTKAGFTIEQAAQELLVSPSKISRIETGHRTASLRDIRDLCNLYQVTDSKRRQLTALAEEEREEPWWQPYDLPSTLATFVGLETEATRISDFEPDVIPGLLQVAGYARAIHENTFERLSDPAIGQRIEMLQSRKAILTRKNSPVDFRAVVDEAAIHRVVGGPAVMSAQLESVIAAAELPNVTLQILSYETGAHPALDSTFIQLDFADPAPSVIYVEGLAGQLYFDRPQDVERYESIFKRLQVMACDERESVNLLKRAAAAYKKL